MKYTVLIFGFAAAFTFFGCSDDKDKESYMKIDGRTIELDNGYIYESGYEIDNSVRKFNIRFTDSYFDEPDHFLQFQIYSYDNNDKEPEEGVYNYVFLPQEPLDFSYLQFARNVDYNEYGEYDGGYFYFDNFCNTRVLSGSVDFYYNSPKYEMYIEAKVLKNQDTIDLEAYYYGRLSVSDIDFLDYVPCNQ